MQASGVRAGQGLGAGLMFIAVGSLGLWFGRDLALGNAQEMGPGYAPIAICWGLVLLGAVSLMKSLMRGSAPMEAVSLRAVLGIGASLCVFAATISSLGLVAASIATVFTACLIEPKLRWREMALLSIGLAVVSVVLFVWLLRIPFQIWPTWTPWT